MEMKISVFFLTILKIYKVIFAWEQISNKSNIFEFKEREIVILILNIAFIILIAIII